MKNPKEIYVGTVTEFVNNEWVTRNTITISHSFKDVYVEEEGKILELHTIDEYDTIEQAQDAYCKMLKEDNETLKQQNKLMLDALNDSIDFHHHIGNEDCPYTNNYIFTTLYKIAQKGLGQDVQIEKFTSK